MGRAPRLAFVSCLLALGACGMAPPSPSSAPSTPQASAGTVTAKTALTILRAKSDVGDRRILSVSSDDAPRGFAARWKVIMASVKENEITTYAVSQDGLIGEPVREAYNAVFDTQSPPFTEQVWTLDSNEAARQLPDPGLARILYLEADEAGALHWSLILADGTGLEIGAGKTPLDTPLPSHVPRQPAKH
jgi:hypothetical protein